MLPSHSAGRPARARLIPGLALQAGDTLAGRFRVLSLVRADRLCVHLAGAHGRSNEPVEIQILLAMDDNIEGVRRRFLDDARVAVDLDEPHLVRVLHAGLTEDGHPFVVREPTRGATVASHVEARGAFATADAVDVAIAVCAALESAHAAGLVHGALDATLVRASWGDDGPSQVKVADIGTSRALAMLSLDARALASLASRAPELLSSDREIDARADLWGVGILLYTMLAGQSPFAAESPSCLDLDLVQGDMPMLAGVPDGLADIVAACLARDPARRPASALVLAQALARWGCLPVAPARAAAPAPDRATATARAHEGRPHAEACADPPRDRVRWQPKALVAAAVIAVVACGAAASLVAAL